MAMRMQSDPKYKDMMDNLIANDGNLVNDMLALKSGDMQTLLEHVDGNYDFSADYWKVLGDGTLVNDGDGWLKDASGNRIKNAAGQDIGAQGIETGLLNILNGGTSNEAYGMFSEEEIIFAQSIMEDSGMTASNSAGARKDWQWGHNEKGQRLNMDLVMFHQGDSVAGQVFERYYNHTVDTEIAGMVDADMGFDRSRPVHIDNRGRYNDLMNDRLTSYGPYGDSVQDALFNKYRQKIGDVTTFRLDENNPIVSDLMSQHDDAFKAGGSNPLEGMGEGCNVMSVLAYPQMLAGEAFTAEQFADIWRTATHTIFTNLEGDWDTILSKNGRVNQPDLLAHMAFKELGLATGGYSSSMGGISMVPRTGIRLSFGYDSYPGMELIGNRLKMNFEGGGSHYLPGGLNKRPFSNSGYSFLPPWENYTPTEVWARNLN